MCTPVVSGSDPAPVLDPAKDIFDLVSLAVSIGCYSELYCVDGIALKAFEDFRDGCSDDFIPGAPNVRMMAKTI